MHCHRRESLLKQNLPEAHADITASRATGRAVVSVYITIGLVLGYAFISQHHASNARNAYDLIRQTPTAQYPAKGIADLGRVTRAATGVWSGQPAGLKKRSAIVELGNHQLYLFSKPFQHAGEGDHLYQIDLGDHRVYCIYNGRTGECQ